MSKNYLRLQLGETIVGLKFNMGTYKFIKELTNEDPLQFVAKSNSFEDVREFGKKVFHAALLSNCQSQKKTPDFSEEDVETLFNEISTADLTKIISMYSNPESNTPVVNGEVVKDTQSAALLG